jgi:hypothetical protein
LRDPHETQNSRNGADHAGAERGYIEDQKTFDDNENLRLVKTKELQRQFGLLPATACTVAELSVAGSAVKL